MRCIRNKSPLKHLACNRRTQIQGAKMLHLPQARNHTVLLAEPVQLGWGPPDICALFQTSASSQQCSHVNGCFQRHSTFRASPVPHRAPGQRRKQPTMMCFFLCSVCPQVRDCKRLIPPGRCCPALRSLGHRASIPLTWRTV